MYAKANADEDISVLVEQIYFNPKVVKKAMGASGIFHKKIDILHKYGYIRDDQHLYLTADGPKPEVLSQYYYEPEGDV